MTSFHQNQPNDSNKNIFIDKSDTININITQLFFKVLPAKSIVRICSNQQKTI